MHQDHANFPRVDPSVVASHFAYEVVQLGTYFDPRESAARHDECEKAPAEGDVLLFDRSLLESSDDVIAQLDRVAQVLEGEGVLG